MNIYWWLVLITFYIIPAITMFFDNYRWLTRRIKRKQQIVVSDIFDFLFICCIVTLLPIINMKTIIDYMIVWFDEIEERVIFKWDNK